MKVIILSAGQGRRLLPYTKQAPKCLVPIQGRPLLAWQIEALHRCGIEDITVVVGFMADAVETKLAELYGEHAIRTVYNPFYDAADNLISCWVAREEMREDFLLLNGDTLFEPAVLERLLAAPEHPVTLAVSRKDHYDGDDMKVVREGDRLVRVGKTLALDQVNAESIGLMSFRGQGPHLFRAAIEQAIRDPRALKQWYLSLIDALADKAVVWTQPIWGLGWTEVDCPADLHRAAAPGAPWLVLDERRAAQA